MKAFILLGALLQCVVAFAHGDDKPKHGGIMGRGDDSITVEFVFDKGAVSVYVEDHDSATPIPAENLKSAWLNVLGPGQPAQEAKLTPAGANKLTAGGFSPRVGDRITAHFILPDGIETRSIATYREAAPRR
jgi:hypothetical protein